MEEFKTNKKALKRVKEFLARDYIKKRESLDLTTEEKRYPFVFYLSSPEIAKEFDDEFDMDKNPLSPYKLAVDNNWLRYIRIISSEMLNLDQIRVEFEATTTAKSNGKVLLTEVMIAIVSFAEDTNQYKGADYLANPFGFVVSDYSLSVKERRDNKNKSSPHIKIKQGTNDDKKPIRAFN